MENEFLIFDYLDGKMTAQQEESFFNLLSQNDELRTEFKQQLALKTAFTKDLHTFVPSPETTMSLFSKMGIGAGAGAVSSALVNSSPSIFSKVLGVFGTTAFKSAAVTLIAAGATFFGLLKYDVIEWYDEEGSGKTTIALNSNKIIESNETPKPQEINANNNSSLGENTNNSEPVIKVVEKIVTKDNFIFTIDTLKLKGEEKIKAKTFFDKLEDKFAQLVNDEDSNINSLEISELANYNFNSSFNNIPNGNFGNLKSQPINFNNSNMNLPISFELGGSFYNSKLNNANNIDINRDYSSILNGRLSLFYNQSSEFQIGVDYRVEDFFQQFSIIDGNGRLLTYYQQPEFTVMSGVLRYLPDYLDYDFGIIKVQPLISASYGADLIGKGTVSRAGIGSNFYFGDNLYFQAMVEYSNLSFKQDEINYNSNKLGVNVGIGYNLSK